MISALLVIVIGYVLAAGAVHAASLLAAGREPEAKHFVLIAGNHQLQMEWYMRALQWHALWRGREVRVTIVNRGSEDETMDIARLFTRSGMDVRLNGSLPQAAAEVSAAAGAGEEAAPAREESVRGGDDGRVEGADRERPGKWQRFRVRDRRPRTDSSGGTAPEERNGRRSRGLYWMAEAGAKTDREQPVLVDLSDPAHLSKLPL